MASSVNRSYLPEVDQLRAIAAMLVLLYHGLQLLNPSTGVVPNPLIAVLKEGHSGVGLFIVLSGFILTVGTAGKTISYKEFMIARILRIYPMLLVCLVFAINLGGSATMIGVLTTALPFNVAAVSGGIPGSFTAMFWAVAVEFQCYLIFPFLLMFSNTRGSRFLVQLIAIAVLLRALAVLTGEVNARDISYWTIAGRIDQFCIGMIAARLYSDRALKTIDPAWFVPAGLLSFGMLWGLHRAGGFPSVASWKIIWPDAEGAVWAFFIVTYISAGRMLPRTISLMAKKLGEISYSSYLIHFAVIKAVINRAAVLHITGHPNLDALVTTVLIVVPVTVAIALLTFHTIEAPFLRLRPKYVSATSSPATPQ
jgi:peptidoglycan/LPS O-acetylase OafA/YrhL